MRLEQPGSIELFFRQTGVAIMATLFLTALMALSGAVYNVNHQMREVVHD